MSELSKLKEREAAQRIELIRKAQKSPRAAKAIQKQVSLAGQKAWKITNSAAVGRAMQPRPLADLAPRLERVFGTKTIPDQVMRVILEQNKGAI